jgi:iron only hydrogenase large subunit-like protein
MMHGAVLKEFTAKRCWADLADRVYLTSVMPCVRKRGESDHAALGARR